MSGTLHFRRGRKFPQRISREELYELVQEKIGECGVDLIAQAQFTSSMAKEVVGHKDHIFSSLQPKLKLRTDPAWRGAFSLVLSILEAYKMQITLDTIQTEVRDKRIPTNMKMLQKKEPKSFLADIVFQTTQGSKKTFRENVLGFSKHENIPIMSKMQSYYALRPSKSKSNNSGGMQKRQNANKQQETGNKLSFKTEIIDDEQKFSSASSNSSKQQNFSFSLKSKNSTFLNQSNQKKSIFASDQQQNSSENYDDNVDKRSKAYQKPQQRETSDINDNSENEITSKQNMQTKFGFGGGLLNINKNNLQNSNGDFSSNSSNHKTDIQQQQNQIGAETLINSNPIQQSEPTRLLNSGNTNLPQKLISNPNDQNTNLQNTSINKNNNDIHMVEEENQNEDNDFSIPDIEEESFNDHSSSNGKTHNNGQENLKNTSNNSVSNSTNENLIEENLFVDDDIEDIPSGNSVQENNKPENPNNTKINEEIKISESQNNNITDDFDEQDFVDDIPDVNSDFDVDVPDLPNAPPGSPARSQAGSNDNIEYDDFEIDDINDNIEEINSENDFDDIPEDDFDLGI